MSRLPSSLKWLVDRRARIAGEIQKFEQLLEKCDRLANEIRVLKDLLVSVDQTMALHDIPIDVSLIQPIKSKEARINLPHGELTRAILLCLKLNDGRQVTTDAVAAFVAARCADLHANANPPSKIRESVRYRLKDLCRQGWVKRFAADNNRRQGVWALGDRAAEQVA